MSWYFINNLSKLSLYDPKDSAFKFLDLVSKKTGIKPSTIKNLFYKNKNQKFVDLYNAWKADINLGEPYVNEASNIAKEQFRNFSEFVSIISERVGLNKNTMYTKIYKGGLRSEIKRIYEIWKSSNNEVEDERCIKEAIDITIRSNSYFNSRSEFCRQVAKILGKSEITILSYFNVKKYEKLIDFYDSWAISDSDLDKEYYVKMAAKYITESRSPEQGTHFWRTIADFSRIISEELGVKESVVRRYIDYGNIYIVSLYKRWKSSSEHESQNILSIASKYIEKKRRSKSKFCHAVSERSGISVASIRNMFIKDDLEILKSYDMWREANKNDLEKFIEDAAVYVKSVAKVRAIDMDVGESSDSIIETITIDLSLFCGLPIEYYNKPLDFDERIAKEAKVFFKDRTFQKEMPRPDFINLEDNSFFEIMGYNRDNYRVRMEFKIKILPKYINLRYLIVGDYKYSLLSTANLLDTEVCIANTGECGISLIDGVSISSRLTEQIPLLSGYGIKVTGNYISQLAVLDDIIRDSLRREFTVIGNKDRLTIAQSKNDIITLEKISFDLNKIYDSVQYWTDEEKVAVYFKTPERLQQEIDKLNNLIQQREIEDQSLPKAAKSNWYIKCSFLEKEHEI